jgi:hypothetical protein
MRRSGGSALSHRTASSPRCGAADMAIRAGPYLGSRSGSAGETSVSDRTSSGRVAATLTEMAPPSELPNRWTGPPMCSARRTTAAAWPSTV